MVCELYVERKIKKEFDFKFKLYNNVVLLGPRRSGKTTFLIEQIKNNNGTYLTFDDPDIYEVYYNDVKLFEKQFLNKEKVHVLDELDPNIPNLGRKIKYLIDKGYSFWITSSANFLKKEILGYLVGRIGIVTMYPFDFSEFLVAKKIDPLLIRSSKNVKYRLILEHALYGGFPKVVLTENQELKKIYLLDLLETIIYKDIINNFHIENERLLKKLIKSISFHVGNIIKYREISRDLNISFQTVKKYLDILELNYIIKLISPFCNNPLSELSKTPKVYFIDNGLLNVLLKEQQLTGRLFENYVFTELLKRNLDIKYWRTKDKQEVDFIINNEIPIEVKLKGKLNSGLKSFIEKYSPEIAYVICMDKEEVIEYKGCEIHFIDPSYLNELNFKHT